MKKDELWKIITGLGLAFGAPFLFLILIPFLHEAKAEPVPYTEEDGIENMAAYPDPGNSRFGESDLGARVYAQEGCAYCHTQMVRPTYAGPDMWLEGWGGRPGLARETRPEDYSGEGFAFLGYQRIGQDLSNVGSRISDKKLMHQHLYDPQSLNPGTVMPAYKHLYTETGIGDGYAPTSRAIALVDYLLSRKKDAVVPGSGKSLNE